MSRFDEKDVLEGLGVKSVDELFRNWDVVECIQCNREFLLTQMRFPEGDPVCPRCYTIITGQ